MIEAVKVLLVDDHNLVREGIKLIFAKLDPQIEVVEGATYDDAVAAVAVDSEFDLVLLDLLMPGMDGLEGLQDFRRRHPELPVAILSGAFRREDVFAALERGAIGFLPKTLTADAMLSALKLMLTGEAYLPSMVYFDAPGEAMPPPPSARADAAMTLAKLTQRERDILMLLVSGNTNKEIANELSLREPTVRSHLKNIFRKMGVKNRAHAVGLALRSGMVD